MEPGWHYCGVTTARPNEPARRRLAPARLRAAAALAGAVLLAHAWLLALVTRAPGPGWRAQPPHMLRVRSIVAVAAPLAAPVATVDAPVPHRRSAAAAAAAAAAVAGLAATGAAAAGPSADARKRAPPAPAPVATAAPAPLDLATQTTQAPAVAEPTPDPGGQTVPVYATQTPPPLTLQYDLRRGMVLAQAELDWRPLADHYQLTLRSPNLGAPPIDRASQGGFDSAGLAPLRHTESRRGRELRAANFQRDSGRITFSGPAVEYPLVAGAQDRLSWMVQLAAVLAANPALAETDAQISMWVVGTRGDAEVWTFTVQGRATLELPIGRVDDAVHLTRLPRRPYDTLVQVWLDPALHFVPVKVLLAVRAGGDGTAFELRQVRSP